MNNELMFSSKNQAWDTPQNIYDALDDEFDFTLDPCCTTENCKCPDGFYYDDGVDGLKAKWFGRVFMNPPYGREQYKWVRRANDLWMRNNGLELVVGLLPARTDTKLFHEFIWNTELSRAKENIELHFLKGRITFGSEKYWRWVWEQEYIEGKKNKLYKKYGKKNPAPFPSMVVIWK